jgi:5-methylcytosine-specific restriction protein A
VQTYNFSRPRSSATDRTPPTTEDFQRELTGQIERATKQGRPHIEVNAGELHRKVGGYPPLAGQSHRMRIGCSVMRDEKARGKAEIIFETASGQAPALTIRYYLPRPA